MNDKKSQPLKGASNQRLDKTSQSDSQSTAAWAGTDHYAQKSNVSIPKTSAVENAKEWVDNGSRL
uniref:DUF3787 domain-containing protein n=1 Tax=Eubacterium plexicaudatum ASF492 TaxID=1235802 RepID=N2AIX7_9FIRM